MFSKADKKNSDKELQNQIEECGINQIKDKEMQHRLCTIAADLLGTRTMRLGMILKGAKVSEQLESSYLSAIVQQNFIMIRQLDKISSQLKPKEDGIPDVNF